MRSKLLLSTRSSASLAKASHDASCVPFIPYLEHFASQPPDGQNTNFLLGVLTSYTPSLFCISQSSIYKKSKAWLHAPDAQTLGTQNKASKHQRSGLQHTAQCLAHKSHAFLPCFAKDNQPNEQTKKTSTTYFTEIIQHESGCDGFLGNSRSYARYCSMSGWDDRTERYLSKLT